MYVNIKNTKGTGLLFGPTLQTRASSYCRSLIATFLESNTSFKQKNTNKFIISQTEKM